VCYACFEIEEADKKNQRQEGMKEGGKEIRKVEDHSIV
jgi:hypothetical protein